jgi:hypothetical protein
MATFSGMQLDGYIATEDELKDIARLIAKDYQTAGKAVANQLKDFYASNLVGVDPDKYYAESLKYKRLNKLYTNIQDQYAIASQKVARKIAASSELAVTNNYYKQRYALSSSAVTDEMAFGLINPHLVEASVYGTQEAWSKIQSEAFEVKWGDPKYYMREGTLTELLTTNRNDTARQIRRKLSSDLLQGKGYRETARDIRAIIGTTADGEATGALAKALRIVRTEGNRNLNAGNLASTNLAKSEGIDIARTWTATLDGKTRPAHGAADGRKEDKDGFFLVDGEQLPYPSAGGSAGNTINCRCTVIDVVDGQPPQGRRGRDPLTGESKVFDYTTYDDYMKSHKMTQTASGKWRPTKVTPIKKGK